MAYERGEARHTAKLTETDVLDIRRRYHDGAPLKEPAKLYPQCSKVNLHHIVHNRRWAWLKEGK